MRLITTTNSTIFFTASYPVILIGLLFIIIFNGCKPVGENYKTPQIKMQDQWDAPLSATLSQKPNSTLENWWTIFNDTNLNNLITIARENNKDLKIAFSRIVEARANFSGVKGSKLPSVVTDAKLSETKLSDNGALSQLAPAGGFVPQSLFGIGIDATWEIDVFGRVRRSVEAAGYSYQVKVADYYDVMVLLLADVAADYVQVRANQQQIITAQLNVVTQQQSLELAEFRYQSGLTSYLDVVQAKANLAETKASIPEFEIEKYLAESRIAILLGLTRDSLKMVMVKELPIPQPDSVIAIGIPADILRQRPDVRAAERTIARQTAQAGVVTADLYPTFALAGFLGFDSKSAGTLFTLPGMNWGASLPVKWSVLNRKRIKANIAIANQQTDQAVLNYENTVLKAVIEVENAMASYEYLETRNNFLKQAVADNNEAVSLVNIQYQSGLTDFQNVLDTERSLYRQQNQQIACDTKVLLTLIKLYKSVGGGWPVTSQDTVPVIK